MENFYLILAAIFFMTFLLGKILEKIKIPWVFSGVFVGMLISLFSFSKQLESDSIFLFLSTCGMYFLLFIIGFEIDLKEILKQNRSILKTTFMVIFLEILLGSVFLHYIFNLTWLLSAVVASSFATVGEAVLLPILDELNLTKKKLGIRILSVGIIDDIFEILVVILVSVFLTSSEVANSPNYEIILLPILFLLVYVLFKLHNNIQNFSYKDVNSLFLFILFFIFLFVGIGEIIDSSSLGALLAGLSIRNLVPQKKLDFIESEIKAVSYGFLAPLFFVWVGLTIDLLNIFNNFWKVLLIVLITIVAKVLGAYITERKEFGAKESIFIGFSLTVKLSMGIVVLSILHDNMLITNELFSVLIGASIIFTVIIPLLLPILARNWKINI